MVCEAAGIVARRVVGIWIVEAAGSRIAHACIAAKGTAQPHSHQLGFVGGCWKTSWQMKRVCRHLCRTFITVQIQVWAVQDEVLS